MKQQIVISMSDDDNAMLHYNARDMILVTLLLHVEHYLSDGKGCEAIESVVSLSYTQYCNYAISMHGTRHPINSRL
jgi:hypothetical protein